MVKVDEYRAIAVKLRHEATFASEPVRQRRQMAARIFEDLAAEMEATEGVLFSGGYPSPTP